MLKGLAPLVCTAWIVLVFGVPAEAGRLGWLDKLSGPGKFYPHKVILGITPCTEKGVNPGLGPCMPDNRLELKYYVTFEYVKWKSEHNDDFPKPVDLSTVQGIFYYPLVNLGDRKVSVLHAFDVGAGMGVYFLTGEGVKTSTGLPDGRRSRLSIPIRLRFTPSELFEGLYKDKKSRARLALSSLYFRIGFDAIPGAFSAKDFIGPADYRDPHSFLKTGSVIIDGTRLAAALFNW